MTSKLETSNSLTTFEVSPTGVALGAELRGLDLSQPVPSDVAKAVQEAWHEHLVVLIRGQDLSPTEYLSAARMFGTPQPGAARTYYQKTGKENPDDGLGIPELMLLTNLDRNGNPALANESLGSGEVVWHSDNSYIDHPPAGSILYAREIPPDGSGRTAFNNQYQAYEDLPDDLSTAIDGRAAKHDATRNSAGVLRPGVELPKRPEDVPGPMHPLVRTHPGTDRSALYLGRRRDWPSQFIEGYDNDTSEALLDRLWLHATQPQYEWLHRWQVGDIVVWDNRCTMHYREPLDPTARRVMWRSQFQGEPVIPA